MVDANEVLENEIIDLINIREYIERFDPEIKDILYDSLGRNLKEVSKEDIEKFLESLLRLDNIKYQKFILLRYGFVNNSPMTIQEIADELEIKRDRAIQIERRILRSMRPHYNRRKRLVDFLNK